jgi:phospholipase D1/2
LTSRGVVIRIILYKEPALLANNSAYTQTTLEKIDPMRVKVIRHPDTVVPFLWSHHEKLLIIDETVAFAGGFDICYGRYDTCDHAIFDYAGNMYPGIEYTNERKQ